MLYGTTMVERISLGSSRGTLLRRVCPPLHHTRPSFITRGLPSSREAFLHHAGPSFITQDLPSSHEAFLHHMRPSFITRGLSSSHEAFLRHAGPCFRATTAISTGNETASCSMTCAFTASWSENSSLHTPHM